MEPTELCGGMVPVYGRGLKFPLVWGGGGGGGGGVSGAPLIELTEKLVTSQQQTNLRKEMTSVSSFLTSEKRQPLFFQHQTTNQ